MPVENNLEQKLTASPERIDGKPSLEIAIEKPAEKKEVLDAVKKTEKLEQKVSDVSVSPVAVTTDDYHQRRGAAIDAILADGLDKVFLKMSPADQRHFKAEGEKTVNSINQLLDKAKAGVGKIISLIKRWLGLIPGANKYYLEQEAKIKADRILKIKKSL